MDGSSVGKKIWLIQGDFWHFSSQYETTTLFTRATSDIPTWVLLVLWSACWLAGPASAVLSSCEPSAPSQCTHLVQQNSCVKSMVLTLVSTHPNLHMRWVLHFFSGPFVMSVDIINAVFFFWGEILIKLFFSLLIFFAGIMSQILPRLQLSSESIATVHHLVWFRINRYCII